MRTVSAPSGRRRHVDHLRRMTGMAQETLEVGARDRERCRVDERMREYRRRSPYVAVDVKLDRARSVVAEREDADRARRHAKMLAEPRVRRESHALRPQLLAKALEVDALVVRRHQQQ